METKDFRIKLLEWACWAFFALCALTIGRWSVINALRLVGLDEPDWAAWVQAIGSIAALAVAIFVMSRQNEHSARLIAQADKLALNRRVDSITAVVERARDQFTICCDQVQMACTMGSPDEIELAFKFGVQILSEMRPNLQAIPIHDLGSYDMARGVIRMIEAIGNFESFQDAWMRGGRLVDDARNTTGLLQIVHLETLAIFKEGVRKLKGE